MDPIITGFLTFIGAASTQVLAALAGKLIDRGLSNIYTEEAVRQSISNYTERIKQFGYDPITESILISEYPLVVKKQKNKNNIVKIALEELKEQQHLLSEEKIKSIDEDWLNMYFDAAEKTSKAETQYIWGRLLAGEFTNPGSVPKTLIHILSIIEKEQARAFVEICKHCIYSLNEDILNPVYFCDIFIDKEYWSYKGIDISTISELESIGLLKHFSHGLFNHVCFEIGENEKFYLNQNRSIELIIPKDKQIAFGDYDFSTPGFALCKIIIKDIEPEIEEHIKIDAIKKGFKLLQY